MKKLGALLDAVAPRESHTTLAERASFGIGSTRITCRVCWAEWQPGEEHPDSTCAWHGASKSLVIQYLNLQDELENRRDLARLTEAEEDDYYNQLHALWRQILVEAKT